MRTHVELRSDAFGPEPGEEETINPGCWGRALAVAVAEGLTGLGAVTGEPEAEDWGWRLPVVEPAGRVWIGCGSIDGVDDGFLCFVEAGRVRRGLRWVVPTEPRRHVADLLDQVLSQRPEVVEHRWWSTAEADPRKSAKQ